MTSAGGRWKADWTSDAKCSFARRKNDAGASCLRPVESWAVYEGALVRAILFLKFENIEPLENSSHDGWRKQSSRAVAL